MYNDKLTKSIAEAVKKCMDEELKGNQHKIDANKNGKIDADDFKKLRKEETVEEAMQKADVPAYLRKQKGEKPLSVADVKGPRPDSISSKEGLAKLRNEEQIDELSKSTLGSYVKKASSDATSSASSSTSFAFRSTAAKNPRVKDAAAKISDEENARKEKRLSGIGKAVTRLSKEEVEQIEEADIEKTATGMRVYGSSYGNSVRARREQVKKSVDTAKGPKMKDLEAIEGEKKKKKFSEMVETYVQSGIQGLFEGWKKVKEEATNDEFKTELEKQKAKAAGTAPQADVAKAAVQAVQQEETIVEGYTVGEKTPNKQGGHNQDVHYNGKKIGHIESYSHRTGMRYGSHHDATGDMTAGNRSHDEAMADLKAIHKDHMSSVKEEVEQLDELKKATLGSYVKKASKDLADRSFDHGDDEHRQYGMGDGDHEEDERVEKDEKKIATRQQGINRAATKLAKEEVEQLDELSPGALKSYIKGAKASKHLEADAVRTAEYKGNHAWASDATQIVNKRKEGIKTAKAKLNAEEVEQVEERTLSEPEMKKREEVVKSMKKGIQGFKDRYGDRAKEVMYATATKIAKKD